MVDEQGVLFACVQGSNDAIMLTDVKGVIFFVNTAWQRLFGYSSNEALGQTPRLLRSAHHETGFYHRMWSDILDPAKKAWRGEVINLTKDGREIPVWLTISPFLDNQNQISGYMSVACDLSEQKKMQMRIQWQDRLTTLGLLTEGLAHEMGTPLGVARGRAEYLMRLSAEDSFARKNLSTIVTQIDKVSKLMEALQNLSQNDTSEIRIPVNIAKVVSSVQRLIEGKLLVSGITFTSTISNDALVYAEPSKLGQVLISLCINSIHALEDAKNSNAKHPLFIKLTASEKDKYWEIAVADNGGGIAEDSVKHLFKPFFTTKEVGVGTGLGLAAVNEVVRHWNGHIDLENIPGSGVTFKIVIPKANVPQAVEKQGGLDGSKAANLGS